jgi:hypothetical protein
MGHYIGYVDNTGQTANRNLIEFLKDTLEDEGWTINRYDTSGAEHYLLVEAPGYTGPDGAVPAFVGFRSYESVASDYYNISVAGMTGYVSANTFATQPGFIESGIPAHNNRIDYWITVNERRVAFGLKVGTPVYEHGYAGFCLPYATPRQYPYPLFVGGMLTGTAATRFSETTHAMYLKGNAANCRLRFTDGSWLQPRVWPWGNTHLMAGSTSNYSIRPTGTTYPLLRPVLHNNTTNVYGELDGVVSITGFDNAVENTLTVDGDDYVVFQDVGRTGFIDYYALKLDPNP